MENQDQNALVSDGADALERPDVGLVREAPADVNSLSAEPETSAPLISQEQQREGTLTRFFRVVRRLDVILALMLVIGGSIALFALTRRESPSISPKRQADNFGTIQIPLGELIQGKNVGLAGANVTINGQLQLGDALYLTPRLQPTGARAGQIYFDKSTNQLAYFNGETFVFLTSPSVTPGDLQSLSRIESLNGVTGSITLGAGLGIVGNQVVNTGVLSVQGQSGNVSLTAGPGIVINGTNFSNSGVISIAAGSPNITVSNDGNGNVTIDVAALPGSGTVTSSGGTSGSVPLFTGAQNIEDSIITQSGLTVTISGDLSVVTGGLTLSTALTVSNGGTGATSLAANGVLIGNGTAAISSVTTGGIGLCLLSTAGAPTWAACPSASGVTSLNGLSGALNIANTSASGNTVTIDDASTTGKGIASFDGANFVVTGGNVDTIQDINSSATPTFGGVNTNSITPSAALTVGVSAQTALLQGSTTTITSNGAGNNIVLNSAASIELQDDTNVTGNVSITGDITVNGGDIVSPGALNITPGGALTIGSTSQTLTLQGGATTSFRATSGANTTVVAFTNPVANTTLNFPALSAGTYTICTTSGNCSGAAATLQSVYDNSTSPEIILDATRGALTLRDNSTPIGANLLEVQNNAGSATYLAVNASGIAVTGTATVSGNVNSSTGAVQTNGTSRIDNSGNLVNIGNVTLSGAISGGTTITGSGNINSTGGALQTNSVTRIDNSGNLINVAALTASGSATFQGGAVTLGTNAQAGSIIIYDGSSNTGTLQVAALGQDTVYVLPDPGVGTATICLTTGNCAGVGGGVTTGGGTTNRIAKFTGTQSLGDSSISDDGTDVTVSVDVIIQGGDVTMGTTSQVGSILLHDGNGQTTTLQAGDSSGNLTFILPTSAGTTNQCLKQSGVGNQLIWQDCDGGSGGSSATLQTAYDNSSNPEITLNSSVGGLTIRDNSTPLGTNLFEIQNNLGSTTYLAVTVSGLSVTGSASVTGNINSTGGAIQTNGTSRIDNSGNLVNIGNITGTGAISIASVGAGNDITIDGADQFIVQDASIFNSLATFNANIDLGANNIVGTTGDIDLTNFDVDGATGSITLAGTINGQTISNVANFTGTVAVAGNTTLGGDIAVNGGDITSSGVLNITPGGALTVGVSAQTALLQGSTTTITSNGAGNDIVLNSADTIELQDDTNVTGSISTTGDIAVNGGDITSTGALNITPGGALTIGSTSQTLTLQGGATTSFRATSGANTTTVAFVNPVANTTLNFPALAAGTYTICTTSGNCSGAAATLQSVYDNSNTPEIILDATRGALTLRDNSTPLGANLLEVQSNDGATTYMAVSATGVVVTGTVTLTGSLNTSGGSLQTNGTTRIDNSGNLINIAGVTASGSATFQGGGLTLGTTSQAGSIVLNDGSSNTGTLQVAALGQDTVYTLPDPGVGTATICLTSGNCSGVGGGVTTAGGTTNRVAKFNGSQSLTDSSITDDGTDVTVSVDVIIQGGDLTMGTTSQVGSILLHDGNGQTTTLQAGNSTGNITFILPTNTGSANQCLKQSGVGNQLVWQDCDGGSGGSSATLQAAYNNSSDPEITLNSSVGGLTIRDNSTPLGANLFEIQNNLGSTTYLAVTVSGLSVTGSTTSSGNINSSGGELQTGGTSRVDNGGNLVNIGNITGTGAVTIASVGAGSDITIDGADQFIVQDSAVFNALSTFNANISLGANDIIGTTGDIDLTNFDVAGATGNVTAGTYNGQTISSSANFTGTVAVAGNTTLTGDIAVNGGDITSTGVLNITPGAALTVGVSAQTALLQGSTTTITSNGAGNDIVLNSADTIELQDDTNVTGTITVSGDIAVNGGDITSSGALNITPGGALTIGSTSQALTLQGGPTSTFKATSGANTTTLGFVSPTANTTLNFPALAAGTYTICTTSGNCSGAAATLQSVYDNSNTPEIILDATRGALTLRDNTLALGANLLEVQNNDGSTTYLAVTASGIAVTGTATVSGNVNSSGGAIQTNGTTRIDNSGNGVNLGSITLSGAISGGTTITGSGNINSTGGAIQTNGTSRIDNSGNLVNIAAVTASGNATFQGGAVTIGTSSQAGTIVLSDGSSNTGTLQVAALGQDTVYTLPDPGAGTATICLTTGNCAGTGGGVTTGGGTTNRIAKFTGAQSLGDSSISDDGTDVTVSVDVIIQGGDLTVGTTAQQGSLLLHDGNGQTTTLQAGDSTGNITFILPTNTGSANQCLKQSGTGNQLVWQDCDGGSGGSSATLQTAYNNSTSPEIVLDATRGALTLRDNSTPLGANLLEIQNNLGSTTYLAVTVSGLSVTGAGSFSGNINSSGGALQTNGTTRIDNSGNASNIGNLGLSGAISGGTTYTGSGNINSTGGTIQTNSVSRIDNSGNLVNIGNITGTGAITISSVGAGSDITIDGADQFIVQDSAVFNALATFNAGIDVGANNIVGTTGDIDLTNFDVDGATGDVTAGTYNGQTISSSANFTGTVAVAGNTTLTGDIAVNGGDLTSTGALNITPGGTLTVGVTGQQLILQGNANTRLSATGGGFTTILGFSGSPTGAVTYNLDRAAAAGTYTICTSVGNCAGVGGGVTTAGGTTGTLAKFTGSQTLGDSLLSEAAGVVTVNGNLNLTSGNQFRVNGTQISSANLSNDANLAKLNASQTFTGNTVAFQNGTNSTNAFNVQNQAGHRVLTIDTTSAQVVLGVGSTLDGKLVFSNVSNNNTVTILPGTPTNNRTLTLPDASGIICTDSGNCAGAGATLQTGYNFSAGGTTPKIKVNSSLLGVDIQDADTTIAANLFNIRASNASGLGSVMFGVGSTGEVTLQNATNSATAFRLLTQGGTAVLTGDTTSGQVLLGTSGTLSGSLVFRNATNSNTITIATSTPSGNRTITLPNATGTVCLDSGNCAGAGGGVTTSGGTTNRIPVFNGAQTIVDSWLNQNSSTLELDNTRNLSLLGGNLSVTGNGTFSGDVAANGGDITSSGALNVTPGGAMVLGATAHNALLQGAVTTITSTGAGNDIILNAADLIDLQDNTQVGGTLTITNTLTANGSIVLGSDSADTLTVAAILQGGSPLVFEGGTADANELTISIANLTGDHTITLPNESGTVCLQGSTNCNFAAASGSANYIQNQNSAQQTSSNFWISGTGRADIAVTTPRLDTATTGALTIGDTNANAINIGKTSSNITTTVNGQFLVKPAADTTTVARVQNAQGEAVMNVDTTSSNLITNSSFESQGTTGWAAHGGAAAPTQTITAHYDNDGALQIAATGANHGARYNFALAASTQYSLSFFVRASGAGFSTLQIGYSSNGSTDTSCATGQTVGLNDWRRVSCTFTTGAVSGTRYIYVKQTDATSRTWYIDAVQLETAAAPTPYRNAKIMLNSSVSINRGPLDAAATDAALYVNALYDGSGVIIQGSGDNDILKNTLDVRSFDNSTSYFNVSDATRATQINGGNGFLSIAALTVTTNENTAKALLVKGAASQSSTVATLQAGATPGVNANLLDFQDSAGLVHGSFNAIGSVLTLGRIAGSGTVSQGQLRLADGTTSNFSSILQSATLTNNRTITLPDASGTVCLTTTCTAATLQGAYNISDVNDEIVLNTTNGTLAIRRDAAAAVTTLLSVTNNDGSLKYLEVDTNGILVQGTVNTLTGTLIGSTHRSQNQSTASTDSAVTTFQSGSVSGATSSSGNVILQSGNSTTSGSTGNVTITTGNATSGNSGSIVLDVGTASGTKGTITVGSTNANQVSIGNNSGASAVNLRSGTGNVSVNTNGSSSGVLIKTDTNSSAAFQLQNASSNAIFNITTEGSSNLVANGGFEQALSNWTNVNGSVTVSRTTASKYSQTAAMRVQTNAATTRLGAKYPITLSNSTTYSMSFYAKLVSGGGTNPVIRMGYSNTGFAAGETDCVSESQPINSTGWTRYSCTFTTPGSSSGARYIYIVQINANTTTWDVDNFMLTQQSSHQQAYYDGSIDISGGAINGPITIQNTVDSTAALQVFGGQAVYGNLTTYSEDMSKAFRFRTSGGALDLETSGSGGVGDLWLSGWTGPNFTGSQSTFLRMSADIGTVMVGNGIASGTPTILALSDKNTSGDPSSTIDGAMYYNSNSKSFRCRINGTWRTCSGGVVFANTSVPSAITSTSDTNFGTNYTIPANDCQPGRVYTITAQGVYSTNISNQHTIRVKWGGTTILTSPGNASTAVSSAVSLGWRMEAQITCISTTAVEAQGLLTWINSSTLVGAYVEQMANIGTQTVTTNSNQNLQMSGQWSTTGGSMSMRQFIVEASGP